MQMHTHPEPNKIDYDGCKLCITGAERTGREIEKTGGFYE